MKKKNRIKKAEEFQKLIKKGRKAVNYYFVFYYADKKEEEARIGITLTKKMGNAVVRNHIKRQVRMMCHELIDFKTFPYDGILIVRFGYLSQDYEKNKKNLEKALNIATIK